MLSQICSARKLLLPAQALALLRLDRLCIPEVHDKKLSADNRIEIVAKTILLDHAVVRQLFKFGGLIADALPGREYVLQFRSKIKSH